MIKYDHWREIAAARVRDMRTRTAYSIGAGMAAWCIAPGPWPMVWTLATLAAQFGSLLITEPMRRDPQAPVSRRREALFFAALALSSVTFAAIGPYAWFLGGPAGQIFSIVLLAGGTLNIALQARGWAPMLWFGAGPFVLLLPAQPLISLALEKNASPVTMVFIAVAILLFALHLIAAGRRATAEAAALSEALAQAERDRLRAEDASAAKSEFLGVISHEIRTPLNGVLGMAHAMAGDRLSSVQKRRLRVLRDSGESLLGLVNDVLDLSELAAEKLELQAGRIDPQALADEAQALFAPLAQVKGLAFEIRVVGHGGAIRAGDPTRVGQMLNHLIGNAVKFTDHGHVRVRIGGSEDALVLEVTDTGAGIAPQRLANLFERFKQADASPTRRYGGAGVGLPLCQGLAQLMGGEISASSTLGEGSVFTARLPAPQVDEAAGGEDAAADDRSRPLPAIAPAADPADAASRAATVRILAAEDNATNRMVLELLLEEVGLSAHMVENGQEALDAWRAAHWDLILMDIQMPVMDGVAATRAIRQAEREEGRPRTPIVALTANALSHQAAEYVAAGMDGLVPKPIEFGQLIAAIANAGETLEETASQVA